jgi:hypothetical protein
VEDQPSGTTNLENSDADGKWIPVEQQSSLSPEQSDKPHNYLKKIRRRVGRPFKYIVKKLDEHDGAVTASATIVIAALTYFIATDGRQQMEAIRGQLHEMEKQRLATIAQSRANLRWEKPVAHPVDEKHQVIAISGQAIAGWQIGPMWTNAGNTDARDLDYVFDIRVVDIKRGTSIGPKDCPEPEILSGNSITKTVPNGENMTLLQKFVGINDVVSTLSGDKIILMWGQIKYVDIFFPETPAYHYTWCTLVSPNNIQSSIFSFPFLVNDYTEERSKSKP